MIRSFDGVTLDKIMRSTPALTHINTDIIEWVKSPFNIALRDGDSFGVFEYEYPGVYTGHYFFSMEHRGGRAIDLSRQMLRWMFDNRAETIRGLTPVTHKAAVFLTRRLGFTDQGTVDTLAGPCYIFTLGRNDFKDKE